MFSLRQMSSILSWVVILLNIEDYMNMVNKIDEQFHYFNIKSGVDSVFGNWAVSCDGDVVNYVYPYAIFANHLKEERWMEIIITKVWHKDDDIINLKAAIDRACQLVKCLR